MAYAAADLKSDLDQIAKIEDLLAAALGDGSGSTSISARAKSVRTRVLAAQDATVELKALSGVHQLYQACLATPEDTTVGVLASSGILLSYFWNALRALYGDVRTAFNDLDVRMHPLAAVNYQKANQAWPDASMVFAYATAMGTATRTSGTWAFTDGNAINSTLYAPSQLVLTPVGTIGAADVTVVLSLTPTAGADPATVTVTLPAARSTALSIGSGRYLDVLNVACTGGTNGDSFTINSVLERSLPA